MCNTSDLDFAEFITVRRRARVYWYMYNNYVCEYCKTLENTYVYLQKHYTYIHTYNFKVLWGTCSSNSSLCYFMFYSTKVRTILQFSPGQSIKRKDFNSACRDCSSSVASCLDCEDYLSSTLYSPGRDENMIRSLLPQIVQLTAFSGTWPVNSY